jgi:hypothetical protein
MLEREATGWIQIEDTKVTGHRVAPGFSGAPVWDEQLGGAVGMVVASDADHTTKAAFIIPTSALIDAWPEVVGGEECRDEFALNPFLDRGRINDPERVFDRDRILREMRQMLAAGNSVSLVGEPQIGKSSIFCALYQTAGEWLPHKRVHYIDLQGVLDEADFCAEVLEGMECAPGDLRALKRGLRRKPLVLLLDEIEKLNRPEFTQDLQDLLRALAQGRNLTLAVASHRPLAEVFPPESPTSPLHNIFSEKRLGPFTATGARRFVRERLRGTGVVFASDEIERLVVESACHPARLQRLACRLFDEKRGG